MTRNLASEISLASVAESNSACLESKERMILAEADVLTRDDLSSALADDNHADTHFFPIRDFYTQVLGI